MDFEFGKAPVVEAIDRVPEQFRGMYEAGTGDNEGKFVLADSHKPAAQAIDGFNKSNRALRTEVAGLKAKQVDLTPWTSLAGVVGIEEGVEVTPEMVREAIEKLQQAPGQSKANYDRMKKDLEDAHGRALKAKDGELSQMSESLSRYLIDSAATAAVAQAKGTPALLLPHIKGMTRVVKEDGEFYVRVVDEQGNYRGGATGGNMTISELVAELKADPIFGRAFESEVRGSATGSPRPGTGGNPAKPANQDAKLTPTDKIRAGLDKRSGAH